MSLEARPSGPLDNMMTRSPASGSILNTSWFGSVRCGRSRKARRGGRLKITLISVDDAASALPARMKNGTPAQRQLSTSRRSAT